MFTVMGSLIACLFWGVVTGLILTGLLFYLPKAIYVRFGYTLPLLLLLVAFFFVSTFQATLFTGAVKAKSYVKSAESLIVSAIPDYNVTAHEADAKELAALTGTLKDVLPLPDSYLKDAADKLAQLDSHTSSPEVLTQNIGRVLRSEINRYLWRRVGWMAVFLVLTAFLLVAGAKKQDKPQPVRRNYDDLVY